MKRQSYYLQVLIYSLILLLASAKAEVWENIPSLPQGEKIREQESIVNNKPIKIVIYKTRITAKEIMEYYKPKLTNFGWRLMAENENRGINTAFYSKADNSLSMMVQNVNGSNFLTLAMSKIDQKINNDNLAESSCPSCKDAKRASFSEIMKSLKQGLSPADSGGESNKLSESQLKSSAREKGFSQIVKAIQKEGKYIQSEEEFNKFSAEQMKSLAAKQGISEKQLKAQIEEKKNELMIKERSKSGENNQPASLNEDVPGKDLSFVPRYHGSIRINSMFTEYPKSKATLTYYSKDDSQSILNFYRQNMGNYNWELEKEIDLKNLPPELAKLQSKIKINTEALVFKGPNGRCLITVTQDQKTDYASIIGVNYDGK